MVPNLNLSIQVIAKNSPVSKNCVTVQNNLTDSLLPAKLGFMISISIELEKYLIKYQSNKHLIPFMYNDLYQMMKFYSCIIKSDMMSSVTNAANLMKIDLDHKNKKRKRI